MVCYYFSTKNSFSFLISSNKKLPRVTNGLKTATQKKNTLENLYLGNSFISCATHAVFWATKAETPNIIQLKRIIHASWEVVWHLESVRPQESKSPGVTVVSYQLRRDRRCLLSSTSVPPSLFTLPAHRVFGYRPHITKKLYVGQRLFKTHCHNKIKI